MATDTLYDVVIVGGGPGGLAAALTLGRARKRVLLCDAGPRRNAAAEHVHNFVTRDGTPPEEFRRIAREQLADYPAVEVREVGVRAIDGERGDFAVRLDGGDVRARRILLCTGMVDELPPIDGVREVWGRSIFACPYCHGWEVQGQRFGCLASSPDGLTFALLLRGWSRDVVAFTNGAFAVPGDIAGELAKANVRVEERRITRMRSSDGVLTHVELEGGEPTPLDVVFLHPEQRQVDLVQSLRLALDKKGYVEVDEDSRETSRPGIYAGGDLTTTIQSAIGAAATSVMAAACLNHDLTVELATGGGLT